MTPIQRLFQIAWLESSETIQKRLKGLSIVLLLSLAACQSLPSSSSAPTPSPTTTPDLESRLTLNNATLEQSNIKGEILWKIQVVEAKYTADQEIAHLRDITGNLFEDGQVVLQISANKGQISKEGDNIILQENIVAVDPRNKMVIRSEEVEWQPSASLLLVKRPIKGSNPELDASANQAQYNTRQQQLTLEGNITATHRDPQVQLKTEQVIWRVPQKQVISNSPVNFSRFEGKTVTDQVKGQKAYWSLEQKLVSLQKNIEYRSTDPPLQIASHVLYWKYQDRTLSTNDPLQLRHNQEAVTLTANKGYANLEKQNIYLHGGVRGHSPKDGANLYSDTLNWNIVEDRLVANGNVIYEQTQPPFNLTGIQAIGFIKDQKITDIVVKGNPNDRVLTEIFPEEY